MRDLLEKMSLEESEIGRTIEKYAKDHPTGKKLEQMTEDLGKYNGGKETRQAVVDYISKAALRMGR